MVGKVKVDALTHELVDYLMGEGPDGIPKDPKHTFKLYTEIGNTGQAIKIAITISNQEQELGNYKYAHDILYETHKDVRANGMHVPLKLTNKLMILHSYMLAKRLVKMGDHKGGAQMLVRVAKNISQFPTHMINILTSTVAECSKAGLKAEAHNWAMVLMQPENRKQIPDSYKKKIENIARRNVTQPDEPELMTPCPFCKEPLPITQLECKSCKNNIPFCIASGRHMTLDDWCTCPSSKMPALLSEYKKLVAGDNKECPMNSEKINPQELQYAYDPQQELKTMTARPKDESDNEGEEEEEEDEAEN